MMSVIRTEELCQDQERQGGAQAAGQRLRQVQSGTRASRKARRGGGVGADARRSSEQQQQLGLWVWGHPGGQVTHCLLGRADCGGVRGG